MIRDEQFGCDSYQDLESMNKELGARIGCNVIQLSGQDTEGIADEMEAYVFTLIRPDVDWKL